MLVSEMMDGEANKRQQNGQTGLGAQECHGAFDSLVVEQKSRDREAAGKRTEVEELTEMQSGLMVCVIAHDHLTLVGNHKKDKRQQNGRVGLHLMHVKHACLNNNILIY